jgi:hypothetical protein
MKRENSDLKTKIAFGMLLLSLAALPITLSISKTQQDDVKPIISDQKGEDKNPKADKRGETDPAAEEAKATVEEAALDGLSTGQAMANVAGVVAVAASVATASNDDALLAKQHP